MELKISELQELKPIDFNYEELKKELADELEKYQNIVYTEETMKLATDDRAKLNKLSKAINDKKIEIHKEFEKPYTEFENKIKTIINMIDEPLQLIDKQIKEFEQKQKDEKQKEIKTIYDEKIGKFKDLISLDKIFNPKWLNKTYKLTTIADEIEHIITKAKNDIEVIKGQFKDVNIVKQVQDFYFTNIGKESVLSESLQEGIRIVDANKKLEELNNKKEKLNNIAENIEVQDFDNKTIKQIDFRVWATTEQFIDLKNYLNQNNIKYGRI